MATQKYTAEGIFLFSFPRGTLSISNKTNGAGGGGGDKMGSFDREMTAPLT